MAPVTILYPSLAMLLLTLTVLLVMAVARYRAVAKGRISLNYYRLFNQGTEPESLIKISRHVHNHFETPPLFHIACVMAFSAGTVNGPTVILAWTYVGLRLAHTTIHLGKNKVTHRFYCFGLSIVALAALWVVTIYTISSQGNG